MSTSVSLNGFATHSNGTQTFISFQEIPMSTDHIDIKETPATTIPPQMAPLATVTPVTASSRLNNVVNRLGMQLCDFLDVGHDELKRSFTRSKMQEFWSDRSQELLTDENNAKFFAVPHACLRRAQLVHDLANYYMQAHVTWWLDGSDKSFPSATERYSFERGCHLADVKKILAVDSRFLRRSSMFKSVDSKESVFDWNTVDIVDREQPRSVLMDNVLLKSECGDLHLVIRPAGADNSVALFDRIRDVHLGGLAFAKEQLEKSKNSKCSFSVSDRD